MDAASIATSLTAARASQTQQMIAAKMMKMNADAAQSIVAVLDAAQQNLEQLTAAPAGMGANVDIRV